MKPLPFFASALVLLSIVSHVAAAGLSDFEGNYHGVATTISYKEINRDKVTARFKVSNSHHGRMKIPIFYGRGYYQIVFSNGLLHFRTFLGKRITADTTGRYIVSKDTVNFVSEDNTFLKGRIKKEKNTLSIIIRLGGGPVTIEGTPTPVPTP